MKKGLKNRRWEDNTPFKSKRVKYGKNKRRVGNTFFIHFFPLHSKCMCFRKRYHGQWGMSCFYKWAMIVVTSAKVKNLYLKDKGSRCL